ncbi:DUF6090 family protein [Rhodohalobacter mucosus]|uniref:Uncharacterized protein n=1 Tax=Rhodohalobacter mucosus TaxID=2079485 RepID=A0A316TZF6_9BACT|nr:DUF6090 family protein [Rhodohalobacter mucosus]PWN05496.1 hypothetical protein DDZ15_12880 [Rhodohalobacter mucosus]
MVTLFRRIRQKLIDSGSATKFLLYAFGEILLVVIGILIALQVNNWNEERVLKNKLNGYYEQIHQEISASLPQLERYIAAQQELADLNRRSLQLLNTSDPDSLQLLESTLGALGTAWIITHSYPVLYEFLDSELLTTVEDSPLKHSFQELSWWFERHRNINEAVNNQYNQTIEPYMIRRFNYQSVALDRYQDLLVEGGPQIDYTQFAGDLELWNMLTLKLEMVGLYLNYQQSIQEKLIRLLDEIERVTG